MKKRAFTLIELLTVIAIIGVLMALLFPAIGGAMNNAKKAQAKNDLMQAKTALTGFYTEYSRYPDITGSSGTGDTEVSTEANSAKLFNILRSVKNNADALAQNPRGISFFEPKQARAGDTAPKGSVDSNGAFWDPWNNLYIIAIDTNYDGIIGDSASGVTIPYSDAISTGISTSVIGWCAGKDKKVAAKQAGSDDVATF